MIQTILAFNPSLQYADRFGRSCFHHAAKMGNITGLRLLAQKAGVVYNQDWTIAQTPPELKIDSLRTIGGETALMKAAEGGSYECCQELLFLGCDPRFKDKLGKDAYRHSISGGKPEVQTMLQQYI